MAKSASKLRQQLRFSASRRWRLLQELLAESPGLIRGTFGTRARVCGTAGCRCARGERHESKYLSATVEGATRQVHVPAAEEIHVAEGVERYKQWRRICAEIAELDAEQHRLMDALRLALLAPYPRKDPIPPAHRRGRKPKERSQQS